jgi:hypothetical protein
MESSITFGVLSIRMVKWWMCFSRESVMVLQPSASSNGYCAVMVANPERSLQISYAAMVLLTVS